MKVFISWSGDRSKRVAELLNTWLKCTIQSLNPWISTRGIGRGELWFPAITKELSETSVGIVCLTSENLSAPWILFEAGALAKGLDSTRVITFLVDITPTDVFDPLAQFNHTLPDKDSMKLLLESVNQLSATPLDTNIVDRVFDKYWPEFEDEFTKIIEDTPATAKLKKVNQDDVLHEILSSIRMMERRVRFIEAGGRKNVKIDTNGNEVSTLVYSLEELKQDNIALRKQVETYKNKINNYSHYISLKESEKK